jgi:hypothetical protein
MSAVVCRLVRVLQLFVTVSHMHSVNAIISHSGVQHWKVFSKRVGILAEFSVTISISA